MRTNIKILLLMLSVVSFSVNAQLEFPEDKVSWKFSIEQDGENATIIGEIQMEKHWHIYAANLPADVFILPTTIELKPSSKFKTVGGVIEPKPIFEHDSIADEDLLYHSGKIQMKRKIKITSEEDFVLTGTFEFQTCDDSHCLPPYATEFSVKVKGVKKDNSTEVSENDFVEVNGDEASDKEGNKFIKFNDEWIKVPTGNTVAFYKKYIELKGKNEQ